MSEPVDHIERPALPWRLDERLTECGKPTDKVRAVITRDAAVAKVKQQGRRRAAMSTCMTCWGVAEFNRDWSQSPTEVVAREAKRNYGRGFGGEGGETLLDRELRAIAALVEAHREEFDGFLHGLTETATLDKARAERRLRLAREAAHRGKGTTL